VKVDFGSGAIAGSRSRLTGVPLLPLMEGVAGAAGPLTVLAAGSQATRNSITFPVVSGSELVMSSRPP